MAPTVINLQQKLSLFDEIWTPKIIAAFEGFEFKVAKAQGEFVWHRHADSDEMFFVVAGQLRIDFLDGSATLNPGEMLVVPKGVEHRPYAEAECHVMTLNRAGEVNTGDAPENEKTATRGVWI